MDKKKTSIEKKTVSSIRGFWDSVTRNRISVISLISLLIFAVAPAITEFRTLHQLVFDFMVMNHEDLMDKLVFPVIGWSSFIIYILIIGKSVHVKYPIKSLVRDNPSFIIAAFLIGWMYFTVFYINRETSAVNFPVALKHETFMLHLLYYFGFFFLGYQLSKPLHRLILLRFMVVISMLMVPAAFYFPLHMRVSPLYDWSPCFEGIFTNPNYYGYFLTVFIGLSAALFTVTESRIWQYVYAASIIINCVALSYTETRGAWVGSFFAIVFLILTIRIRNGHVHKKAIVAFFIFTVTFVMTGLLNGALGTRGLAFFGDLRALLFNADSEEALRAGSGRWKIWMKSFELIREHPVFGIGFEGIHGMDLIDYVGNARPHNEYIQYTLFYGIPGGVLYVAWIISIYVRALKRKARLDNITLAALIAAFGYLVSAFFGLTVFSTAPYLFVMLGMGYIHTEPLLAAGNTL